MVSCQLPNQLSPFIPNFFFQKQNPHNFSTYNTRRNTLVPLFHCGNHVIQPYEFYPYRLMKIPWRQGLNSVNARAEPDTDGLRHSILLESPRHRDWFENRLTLHGFMIHNIVELCLFHVDSEYRKDSDSVSWARWRGFQKHYIVYDFNRRSKRPLF